jgi:CxxC motif-containing protein
MTQEKNIICTVCPMGCRMKVSVKDGKVINVSGNSCSRGIEYANIEAVSPSRTLTTTIKVKNSDHPVTSVKSSLPILRDDLLRCMKVINRLEVFAPLKIGDIVIENILGTGSNIIVTRNVEKKQDR